MNAAGSPPSPPLWQPSPADIERSHVTGLRLLINDRHDAALFDSRALHRWSVENIGDFWRAVWDHAGVIGDAGSTTFVPGDSLAAARFFPDARLNFAENLLRRHDDDDLAMIFQNETGAERRLSGGQLRALVSRLARAMLDHGIEPGDRVAVWLPNVPETYAVMLAAASIGAVFSSTSPDFGTAGVLDRFGQIEPRLLFVVDGYRYGGTVHDCLAKAAEVAAQLPSVERVVVVEYQAAPAGGSIADLPGATTLSDWLDGFEPGPLEFARLPFDHPLYILYSSGTTGAPKCIVHRAGGILLKHLSEHLLHCDVRPADRVFYFTTAGWMMWNWLASGLAVGATLVLYDGSPFHDDGRVLFDLIDSAQVSLFGTSAKFIDGVAKAGLRPADTHDLSSLRTICSTGSPLMPEGFEFVYDAVSRQAHLASISGGTDLCGCLVAGDPTQPLFAGDIQTATFGLDTTVVDASGDVAPAGQRGELVCRTPFPSMPLGFWNDPGDARYHAAYFERFPGVWHQGDFAERTATGGFAIYGRSDATLNPGGVRIGTAEIYRQVEQIDAILEGLVIGQEHDGDTRVVLFVVLRDGVALDDELRAEIRQQVRSGATPRHVPAVIAAVAELPRTRSGKIVELAVRDIVHGRPVTNREALANPEALDLFVPALEAWQA